MKKTKFLNLLKSPDKIQEKELNSLLGMTIEYPYSQALHILVARASHFLSVGDFEKKLNHAAVYTADRKNLKKIIEKSQYSSSSTPASAIDEQSNHQAGRQEKSNDNNLKIEIEKYLEKLRREKLELQFQSETGVSEELLEERKNFIHDLDVKIIEAEAKLANLGFYKEPVETVDALKTDSSANNMSIENDEDEKDFYNELQENLESLKAYEETDKEDNTSEEDKSLEIEEAKQEPEPIVTFSNNVEKERMEEYLASLKSNEEENISNEKLREQIKIINTFIENEPKLTRLDREENAEDIREDLSLKSLKVHQNIASENLAKIMVKQGKLEKAQEIYNKLIWKFPEKKAYFVAQIEKLKKK